MISSNAITSQSQRGLPYGEVNSRNDRRGVFQTQVTTARETPVSAPPVCGFFALYSCRNATTGFNREARNVGGSAANKHTNIKPSSGKISGWMRFFRKEEPPLRATFDLEGDFHEDIRGTVIRLSNPNPSERFPEESRTAGCMRSDMAE